MKKLYIKPATETVAFGSTSFLAASAINVSSASTISDNDEYLSKRRGWSSENWATSGEEE